MPTILITGARGAIGRRVLRAAHARGYRVLGLGHGDWSDPALPAIDRWINGEIEASNLSELVRSSGAPNAVIHLAGGSAVGPSLQQPSEDFQRTVASSQRLLDWLRVQAPAARLVVASSAAIYGDRHSGPIPETAPRSPMSPYATHKCLMELLCEGYARDFAVPVLVLRLFSVYGLGLRKQVVWDLARRCLTDDLPIDLGGTGDETRDFVYIDDAADMLLDACESAGPSPAILNGCTGRTTRIRDLADAVLGAAKRPGAIKRLRFTGLTRRGDPRHLIGDPAAANLAGLTAATTLEDGLARTLAWIRAQGGADVRP